MYCRSLLLANYSRPFAIRLASLGRYYVSFFPERISTN